MLGDLKEGVTELKEKLRRFSLVEQKRRITKMVGTTVGTLLLQLL